MLHQQRNIQPPVPQGWHDQGHDVEAVIQVLAEAPVRDFLAQVTGSRTDHPDIDRDIFRAAEPLKALIH